MSDADVHEAIVYEVNLFVGAAIEPEFAAQRASRARISAARCAAGVAAS